VSALKLNTLVLASALQAALLSGPTPNAMADDATGPGGTQSQALNEAIEAHGGLATWRSYAQMDYATRDFPLGANAPFNFTQTTDLNNRRHLTRGEGFTSGLNEHRAWAAPNVEALGLPPAFFESGNFYFIAMPFVFADPGVIARDLEPITFQGKDYDRVAISYQTGIGSTPEDDYVLYIETGTRRLRMIDFVPTSAEVNGDTPKNELPRKALIFDDWQRADGLMIPGRATFYGWADGKLQGDGNTYYIHDVSFSKDAPNASVFAAR
jgi:hypothetical protein